MFLKEKEGQVERLQRGERGRYKVISVRNTMVRETFQVVILTEGFLRSGRSEAQVKSGAGLHGNPSSLPPAFRKICFAHCLLRVGAL